MGSSGNGANTGRGSGATGLGTGPSGGDVGLTGSAGSGAGCGQMNVPIMPVPADVLIIQDKSSSMKNDDSDQDCGGQGCGANSKWAQVTAALTQVVNATQSSINWGLKLFSDNDGCDASSPPVVGVAPMNGKAIAIAIAATGPSGNTPTRDAVTTGANYLAGLTDKSSKYLLLATDGLPNCPAGCATVTKPSGMCTMTDNPKEDMAAEQAVADASQKGFKTFVIGIGNVASAVNTLNQLAMNGGEAQAGAATGYYAATDPAALEAALNDIVGHVSSCTISLSGAPAGFTNVAVAANDASGRAIAIPQEPKNGWSYGPNMTTVILNGTACSNLKNGTYSTFEFYYACAGTPIKIGAAVAR